MDNLNKVLNPQRPILSGLLQKYTNVMKGMEKSIFTQKKLNRILQKHKIMPSESP